MNNQLLQGVYIDWSKISEYSYLRKIKALKGLDYIGFRKPVTFFVGENGSGKSTLLEAIAVAWGFNPEGGTKNYRFSTYDSHSELCDALCLSRAPRRAGWVSPMRKFSHLMMDRFIPIIMKIRKATKLLRCLSITGSSC